VGSTISDATIALTLAEKIEATREEPTTARQFIEELRKQRKEGYAFIPLVGAGLSAPSGIPIIKELKSYLVKCICRALGLDHPKAWKAGATAPQPHLLELAIHRRWLPGRDQWPPFGDPQIYSRDEVVWLTRLTTFFAKMQEFAAAGEEFAELSIVQEALGACAEWRSSLQFLSRLHVRERHGEQATSATTPSQSENSAWLSPHRLVLGPPNPDIIDTFVLNVVMGKQPTLGHRMLAQLAGPLRVSLALTTNFDDLLEQAFAETNNLFTVFDVHIDAGLPPLRDLIGRNALVKLHGGRFGMRADYSLDTPPTDTDLRCFVSYFLDRPLSDREWRTLRDQPPRPHAGGGTDNRLPARRHLLVVGIGANDERINQMIGAAARAIKDLRVFWICYLRDEQEGVNQLLDRLGIQSKFRSVLQHRFPGLLFLQAYQMMTASLPPSQAVFPAAHRVPVPPEWPPTKNKPSIQDRNREYIEAQADRLLARIQRCQTEDTSVLEDGSLITRQTRCVLMHGPDSVLAGGMSIAAEAFDQLLEKSDQAVWIDLDEIGSVNDLFETMIHTVARKAGIVDWMPVLLQQDGTDGGGVATAQVHELERITNSPNRKWVIFLNARSGPGANLPSYSLLQPAQSNGWMDVRSSAPGHQTPKLRRPGVPRPYEPDGSATADAVVELIRKIGGKECPNVTVVLLCYSGPLSSLLQQRLSLPAEPIVLDSSFQLQAANAPAPKTVENIVQDAIDWVERKDDSSNFEGDNRESRMRFLLATLLASRTRYAAMFWQWPFHQTIDKQLLERMRLAEHFLSELEERLVLRLKTGGFVWMQCRIRDQLREKLISSRREKDPTVQQIHDGLAEWYHRLFRASGDPAAVFEIVHHRCQQVFEILREPTRPLDEEQYQQIYRALVDAYEILETGMPSMLAFGFSKGLCRRLLELRTLVLNEMLEKWRNRFRGAQKESAERDRVVTGLIDKIRIRSLELNRAIAREVGENAIAFERHLELFEEGLRSRNGDPQGGRNTVTDDTPAVSEHRPSGSKEPLEIRCRFRNESCTLGIAVRSYDYCEQQFAIIKTRFKMPEALLDCGKCLHTGEVQSQVAKWASNFVDSGRGTARDLSQLIVALRRRQQYTLAAGHALHTWVARQWLSGSGDIETARFRTLANEKYEHARRSFQLARALLDWLRANAVGSNFHDEFPHLEHERQRLIVQHALTHAFHRDYRKAHARLNDAEAKLNLAGALPDALERGIIELHRAEVLTQEAVHRDRSEGEGLTDLCDFRYSVLKWFNRNFLGDGKCPVLTRAWDEIEFKQEWSTTLRGPLSNIDDAWQTLIRGERCLRRNRKNVWWTTWNFELQIKLVELQMFAALLSLRAEAQTADRIALLPFIGPEAAAYGVPTIAERLIDNTDRMIRLDLFRMARVIESFGHCYLVGQLWANWVARNAPTAGHDPLVDRLAVLRTRLLTARKGLERRRERRSQLNLKNPATSLDRDVANYIGYVVDLTGKLLELPQMESGRLP